MRQKSFIFLALAAFFISSHCITDLTNSQHILQSNIDQMNSAPVASPTEENLIQPASDASIPIPQVEVIQETLNSTSNSTANSTANSTENLSLDSTNDSAGWKLEIISDDSQTSSLLGSEQSKYSPRLPEYFGQTYNILKGNPLSSGIDPGFTGKQLFAFSYDGTKSSDNIYYIPKEVSVTAITQCKVESSSSAYTGMSSYHSDLTVAASASGGYDGLASVSFTASAEYKSMTKTVTEEEKVVTLNQYNCLLYNAVLNTKQKFSDDFIQSLKKCEKAADWDKFVNTWGHYYTTNVRLGASAVKKTSYSREAVQNLQSAGYKVDVAASAAYAGAYGEASSSVKGNSEAKAYFEKILKDESTYYIGRQPPENKNLDSWVSKIRESETTPAPINFGLSYIGELFDDKDLEDYFDKKTLKKMKESFKAAVDRQIKGLSPFPSSDPELPKLKIFEAQSIVVGGSGGSMFRDDSRLKNAFIKATEIIVSAGSQIDSIKLKLNDGITDSYTSKHGGDGGTEKKYTIPSDSRVDRVKVWYKIDKQVQGLQFFTDKDANSAIYGTQSGTCETIEIEGQLTGLVGRSGGGLDAIGFISNIYSYNPSQPKFAYFYTNFYGGSGGQEFKYLIEDDTAFAEKFEIRAQGNVDAIKMFVSNSKKKISSSESYGGNGGILSTVTLGASNSLDGIKVAAGGFINVVQRIQFKINKKWATALGGNSGTEYDVDFPSSGKTKALVGIYGRYGGSVDRIGFIFKVSA